MAFTCPRCKAVSHHPMDEDYGYCDRCKQFVEDMVIASAHTVYDITKAARDRGLLPIWTVFDHPRDYPDGYIARCFETGGGQPDPVPTNFTLMGELPLIRAALERSGLTCLTRNPQDDANIMESWL
jgi:phage FluMu protein Com